jgi:hypothetical protein
MGVYLGQLPPAEIARLKAELAETIIANFCYPRFFDYRTNSLRMRPVDRAKRQEVWLFLSSVDFTTWSRIDLMAPDLQKQIERLFIQFVQRNRSFFGEQGRKRMPDVRMLIASSAAAVTQGLRNHLSGQRQGTIPFGSPRSTVTWSAMSASNRPEPGWEQIATSTLQLQQQLQELRGEIKVVSQDGRSVQAAQRRTSLPPATNQRPDAEVPPAQHPLPQTAATVNKPEAQTVQPATITPLPGSERTPSAPMPPSGPQRPAASVSSAPAARKPETPTGQRSQPSQVTQAAQPAQSSAPASATKSTGTSTSGTKPGRSAALADAGTPTVPVQRTDQNAASVVPVAPAPAQSRSLPSSASQPVSGSLNAAIAAPRENTPLRVGEDDLAIFEEMRIQLIVWLRIEAVHAGVDISGQTPPQLLELLRQQGHLDETRLQVVSTLLNLANQVLKNGQVSVLDYKQALMLHLMHTRHWK